MGTLVTDATGNDLTYRIIGAAMSVHNAQGPGHREIVYERALAIELETLGIVARRQHPITVWHAEQLAAVFYLDLFVEDTVVVELKAFRHRLTDDEKGQAIGYLKASKAPIALLFNFGRRRLEWCRLFPGPNAFLPDRIDADNPHRPRRG